jgi:hypothetical protein
MTGNQIFFFNMKMFLVLGEWFCEGCVRESVSVRLWRQNLGQNPEPHDVRNTTEAVYTDSNATPVIYHILDKQVETWPYVTMNTSGIYAITTHCRPTQCISLTTDTSTAPSQTPWHCWEMNKRQPDYWHKNSYSSSPTINKIHSYWNKPQTLYIIPYSNS